MEKSFFIVVLHVRIGSTICLSNTFVAVRIGRSSVIKESRSAKISDEDLDLGSVIKESRSAKISGEDLDRSSVIKESRSAKIPDEDLDLSSVIKESLSAKISVACNNGHCL